MQTFAVAILALCAVAFAQRVDDWPGICDPPCNDGNTCTYDRCARTGCVYDNLHDGAGCDDGDACTFNDVCTNGVCAGTLYECDTDGNECTDINCVNGDCVRTDLNGDQCDDSNLCTENDVCVDGRCVGTPKNCDDGEACTEDHCVFDVGCTNTWTEGRHCNDGDACTLDDLCGATAADGCHGTPRNCDDGNVCSRDTCIGGECFHLCLPGTPCNDNNPCTVDDQCGGTGGCSGVDACPDGTCYENTCFLDARQPNGYRCERRWLSNGSLCTTANGARGYCKHRECHAGSPPAHP